MSYWRVFLFFIFIGVKSYGQVLPADSLGLVALYNSTNGASWTSATGWLTSNVSSWQGVTVSAGRVSVIDLRNNQLSGSLPVEFCNLSALKYIYMSNNSLTGDLPPCFGTMTSINTIDFANNQLTGEIPNGVTTFPQLADIFITNNHFVDLPDLSSLPELSNVLIAGNKFIFEDIIPNLSVANFQYVPQDSVAYNLDTLADIKDTAVLNSPVDGVGNVYQWVKDGNTMIGDAHFVGVNMSSLTINKLQLADSGTYYTIITNPTVPSLTLYRKIIALSINDTRLDQSFLFPTPEQHYCGDGKFYVGANLNTSLPITISLTSGNATLVNDSITPYQSGVVSLQYENPGDDDYKPIQFDTAIVVDPSIIAAPFITKLLPEYENGVLKLSLPFDTAIVYHWITPSLDTLIGYEYSKDAVSKSDEGEYKVFGILNGCQFFSESIEFFFKDSGLIVYELVTPDGDGRNDFFFVETNNNAPDVSVVLLNVWGQEVFKKENYRNDWSGVNLPGGTYYYVVKVPSLSLVKKGALYLKK